MNEQEEFSELKEQIGQLLLHLQAPLSKTDRQICLLLLEETMWRYYGLKQTADNR